MLCSQDGDEGVALESCEFWSAFCEAAVEPGVLRPFLGRLAPVLLRNMMYDDYDEEVWAPLCYALLSPSSGFMCLERGRRGLEGGSSRIWREGGGVGVQGGHICPSANKICNTYRCTQVLPVGICHEQD